jgi:hypothetical protein
MHDQLAEKFAELFAKCAATGDTSELRKEAAAHNLVKEAEGIADVLTNPLLLAPLGGATIGGLTGYYGTKKDKNKQRNALIGALTGGLGGLSGAVAFGGKPVDGGAKDGDWTTNALHTPRYIADTLGITGGAAAGGKWLGAGADKTFPAHIGELERLAKPAKQPGILGKLLKSVPKNEYTKPLTELFEAHRQGGRPVSESLAPTAPHPGRRLPIKPIDPKTLTLPMSPVAQGLTPNSPEFLKAMDTYNRAMKSYHEQVAAHPRKLTEWQNVVDAWNKRQRAWAADQAELPKKLLSAEKLMQPGANLGVGAERVRNAEVIAEMIRQRTGKGGPVGGSGTGTLHTDLGKVQRYGPGRAARGAGGLVGGGVGGLLTDWLVNLIQNRGAQAAGGAPTLDNK